MNNIMKLMKIMKNKKKNMSEQFSKNNDKN